MRECGEGIGGAPGCVAMRNWEMKGKGESNIILFQLK